MGLGTRGLGDSETWDSGKRGRGTRGRRDAGKWDSGTWDMGTPGRRDAGTPGRRDAGTRDSKTLRLGDVGRKGLEDLINKQHMFFSLNLLSTIFGALEKGYAGELVSRLVADNFQHPWFGLICLLAYFTVKAGPVHNSFNLVGSHGELSW